MGYHEMFSGLLSKCNCGPSIVVGELGCNTGASTIILADLVKKIDATLIVIDWFQGSESGGNMIIPAGMKDRFLENMKGKNFIFFPVESGLAASIIKDETFDLLWIDADHRYHAIKRDIELWMPKVKKGGILCGHDYDNQVFEEQHIEDDYVKGIHHGVTKAVNEKFGVPEVVEGSWWVRV